MSVGCGTPPRADFLSRFVHEGYTSLVPSRKQSLVATRSMNQLE